MIGPKLEIPEETMRALIGDAILTAIDQDARTALIQSAINYLIAPSQVPTGSYGQTKVGPSPIEEAFKFAVTDASRTLVHEWIKSSDEGQAVLRSQLDGLLASYKTKLEDDWTFKTALNEWVIDYLSKPKDRY